MGDVPEWYRELANFENYGFHVKMYSSFDSIVFRYNDLDIMDLHHKDILKLKFVIDEYLEEKKLIKIAKLLK